MSTSSARKIGLNPYTRPSFGIVRASSESAARKRAAAPTTVIKESDPKSIEDHKPARGKDSGSGGPPNGGDPNILRLPAAESPAHSSSSFIPIIATTLISSGLAIFTSFKEDAFAGFTKPIKIASIFTALFTGTVAAALGLTQRPDPDQLSFDPDVNALH